MASTALAQRPRAPLRELRVPQCLTGRRERLLPARRDILRSHPGRSGSGTNLAPHTHDRCAFGPPGARTQWRRGGSCSSTQPDDRVATNTIARSSAWRATPLSPKHSRLAVVAEAKSDGGRVSPRRLASRSSAQSEHCLAAGGVPASESVRSCGVNARVSLSRASASRRAKPPQTTHDSCSAPAVSRATPRPRSGTAEWQTLTVVRARTDRRGTKFGGGRPSFLVRAFACVTHSPACLSCVVADRISV